MGMVLIAPLLVMPQLSAVSVLRLLTAGAAALGEESLDQQLIAQKSAPASAASNRRLTKASASAFSMPSKTAGILATVLATPTF